MKRRELLLVAGLLIVAAAVGYMALRLSSPRHGINEESIKLIQKGMTEAEVVAIVGLPPGHYGQEGILPDNAAPLEGDDPRPGNYYKTWSSDSMGILVRFWRLGKGGS